MCKVLIALLELQTAALMLHKMVFWLSVKVVALHLDISTTKAYLFNEGGTGCTFLSRLACNILNVENMQGINLLPADLLTYLSVEADCHMKGWFQSGTLFLS